MQYSEGDLRAAEAAGVIGAGELDRLIAFLAGRQVATVASASAPARKFDVAHLLWYAGALIVIGAMGLFSTVAFAQLEGWALSATAIVYALAFTLAGRHLWRDKNLYTPGGLLITMAVSMAPLAVFGIQKQLGWWGKFDRPGSMADFYVWIKGSWIFMDFAAIVAGAVALRFFRFPFIVSIIAGALWFMSMDLTPWIFGRPQFSWEERRQVSVWFGLAIIIIAWAVDYARRDRDFAFWLHLFGLIAFWGGISAGEKWTESAWALYGIFNVSLFLFAIILTRWVYALFGALGMSIYLGHLAKVVFKESLLFPFALSLIGITVGAAGLLYHRHRKAIAAWSSTHLPAFILRLRLEP
jgi:hypothetical protein